MAKKRMTVLEALDAGHKVKAIKPIEKEGETRMRPILTPEEWEKRFPTKKTGTKSLGYKKGGLVKGRKRII